MAGSASGEDGANPVLIGYLNRQDGPILPVQDYPLCSRKRQILWCNLLAIIIINPLLTKLVWSRWLDIASNLVLSFLGRDEVKVQSAWNFLGLIFGPGIVWGFVGSPSKFFGF